MKKIIAIIDVSTIHEKKLTLLSEWLNDIHSDSILDRVYMIALTQKEKNAINIIIPIIQSVYPNVTLVTRSILGHEYQLFFTQFGIWLQDIQQYSSPTSVVTILSTRRVFHRIIDSLDLKMYLQFEFLGVKPPKEKEAPNELKQEIINSLPHWFKYTYSPNEKKIGLECISVPDETVSPKLAFIPFDKTKKIITIGKQADITLSIWDSAKGLYDKSAEFEYRPFPFSQWTIRSLRGYRRGNKIVMVNDSIISAANSAIPLSDGDKISLGRFVFYFRTDRHEELVRYENPESLMIATELRLKKHVEKYDISCIPDNLNAEIKVVTKEDGGVSWQYAYLRHYGLFISHNWCHLLTTRFRQVFLGRRVFDNSIKYLNTIRNQIMHPKSEVPLKKRVALVQFYQKIIICTA